MTRWPDRNEEHPIADGYALVCRGDVIATVGQFWRGHKIGSHSHWGEYVGDVLLDLYGTGSPSSVLFREAPPAQP